MGRARTLLFALVLASAAPAIARGEKIFVAVHASNRIERVNPAGLRQLFQGQKTHWPNRRRVRLVIPLDDAPEMKVLAQDVLRVDSPRRVASFYLQRVFQQRASDVPPQLSRTAAVAYVAREPGAIALFVGSAPEAPRSVRILAVRR